MTIKTAIRLSFVIAIGAMIVTATSIGAAFEVTPESKLFSPQPSRGVPTIKRDVSCYTFYTPNSAKDSTADQPSADYIMNKLVKSTKVEATHDTCPIISQYDAQILMAIAQAEAEIDGVEGMAAVMQVVLNRIHTKGFPDTIEEVVTQKVTLKDGREIYQFSPVDIGTYFNITPTAQAHLALAEVEKGNYQWLDALYFENAENSWQVTHCEYVTTIGHHRFYK